MFWDPLLKWAKDTWNTWDIQAILLLSMTLQLILLIFGRLRIRMRRPWTRLFIWASYLMSGWIATVGIGKLSDFGVQDPYAPDTKTSLKALLAPLFLLHLGSPDTITAYSIEDNQLGVREIFEAIAQIGLVVWVMFNCWTYTRLSFLTIPMFCAGLVKYAERAWSLWSALNEEVGKPTSVNIPALLRGTIAKKENADVGLILKAYYRFDRLKPHLENWVHRPYYLSDEFMHIDYSKSEETFRIAEIELGFMYDALYTKAPLIYSRGGFVLRFLAFVCIVLTFCGFALLFKPSLQQDNITYTYAVLLVAVSVELYSSVRLLFTDKAIVWMTMTRFHKFCLLKNLVRSLAWLSVRTERWSNYLYQFNMVGFCLGTRRKRWMTKFLGLCCQDERWEKYNFTGERKNWNTLKKTVLEKMKFFDQKRNLKPFTKCGIWAIEEHGHGDNLGEILHDTICTEFGRSIAIWHIATDICYHMDDHHSALSILSKMLSDYMMHLLVNVPGMLSIPSGPIIFNHLREVLTELCKASAEEKSAGKHLFEELGKKEIPGKQHDPVNELEWSILPEAHKLANKLLEKKGTTVEEKEAASSEKEDKWEVIFGVWTEMLCFAADNCTLYNHAEQLRRGGEFLTFIWILISHNTDRFNTATCV